MPQDRFGAGGNPTHHDVLNVKLETATLSEGALRKTISAIPAVIAITDANGAVEFISQLWSDYTGQDQAASAGVGWLDAVHTEDQLGMAANWESVLKAQKGNEYDVRVLGRDGLYRWFRFASRPYRDETGQIINWYGTAVDIEDKKRAQAALDEMQAKLAQVSRIASLSELAASIAHEINQPLAALLVNADTALRWLSDVPPNLAEARAMLERIQRNATGMDEVVVRLRQMFTKGERRRGAFDLNEALDEVTAFSRRDALDKRILITLEAANEPLMIDGDRVQIQQVLINLITNAFQAIGSASVRQVDIKTFKTAGRATVEVSDSGQGFGQENPESLFESFKTTKTNGMGLGLSISRSIIQDHDGRIWGEANTANGAVFRFELPVIA